MKNLGVLELSKNEMIAINGGRSLPYYVGFAIGYACGEVITFLGGMAEALKR